MSAATVEQTGIEMIWVLDDSDLEYMIEELLACEEVTFDLETTGLDEHAPRSAIVLAAYTLHPSGRTFILPLAHPDSPWLGTWRRTYRKVMQALKDNRVPLCNQNIKFDCRWTYAHVQVDLSHQIVWDTRISSHMLDENRSTKLKVRAPETFNIEAWNDGFDFSRVRADEVNVIDLGVYGASDTYWTWRLRCTHREEMFLEGNEEPEFEDDIENARLGKLATWTAMPTTATLTAMEQRGILLDQEWTQARIQENGKAAGIEYRWLISRYVDNTHDTNDPRHPEFERDCPQCYVNNQDPSFAPTSIYFRYWTEIAVKRGHLEVGALTPSGRPQWSKAVLLRQSRKGSEIATRLLEYRRLTKQVEFLQSWLNQVSSLGTIHTTYNQGSVVTGRLSSSGPNMQQVTKVLKPAFVPRPGYYIAELDYSQIELRVAAFLSRCKPMIEAFIRGDDLHKLLALQIVQGRERTAARAENRPMRVFTLDDITPDERQAGKSANFGLLFQMGPAGFQIYAETVYDVIFTMEEATAVHAAFFDTWVGMREWHLSQIRRAQRLMSVTSPIGRVRRLPDIHDGNPELAATAERQSINSPVQGFASDMMQTAAASIEGNLPGISPVPDVFLIGTVHDSILVEVPIDDWKRATARCMHRMLKVTEVMQKLGCDFDVPLAAEAQISTRWGLGDIGIIA